LGVIRFPELRRRETRSEEFESFTWTSLPSCRVDAFDIYMVGHSATESDLHAMDEHEQRPSKGAAASQRYNISDVDSELIEIAPYAVPSFNAGNTAVLSVGKLGQNHDV